jgi:chaperonin GroEL
VGGRSDPKLLRQHIANLRSAYTRAKTSEARRELRERIGKLMGGSATLWTAGATQSEITARKTLAERTAEAMRGAMLEGVVPGGGAALLACRPRLQRELSLSDNIPERRAAYRILVHALAQPVRTIIANAGYDVAAVMGEIERSGPGCGFEVHSEQVMNLADAGVFDAVRVLRLAVAGAVSGAALALTTDVLVHRKNRPQAVEP